MLRILTLNLNHHADKHGSWAERRERLLQMVGREAPTVMMFQAAARDADLDDLDQPAQIAERAGYPHAEFFPGSGGLGQGIVSRQPWEESGTQPLTFVPNPEDDQRRQLVWARLRGPHGAYYLVNAHFSWVPEVQRINARETLDFLKDLDAPSLLLGDLNAVPDSEAIGLIRAAGWDDLWAQVRPRDPGATFEADSPRLRIDYVFSSPDWPLRPAQIERVGSTEARLSDHLGLLATWE